MMHEHSKLQGCGINPESLYLEISFISTHELVYHPVSTRRGFDWLKNIGNLIS